MHARVVSLFIHPLKSATPISVSSMELDEFGAVADRRWMLVNAEGHGLTQRDHGALALIGQQLDGDVLVLTRDSLPPLRVAPAPAGATAQPAIVWDDNVLIHDAGDEAAKWCSTVVGGPCRLVQMARTSPRALHPKYAGSVAPAGRRVALSDGAPLLLLGEASLAELNRRLGERGAGALGVERFRPNVVISGTSPHDEDQWRTVTIGDVTVGVGTSCPRCVMTTIDQRTGVRAPVQAGQESGEPLRTLAKYRKQGTGVMFGVNATNAAPGVIRVGDSVVVLERRVQAALPPLA